MIALVACPMVGPLLGTCRPLQRGVFWRLVGQKRNIHGMVSDSELMKAYAGGDGRAFEELFRRYAPMLLRTMRKGLERDEDARDLVQLTFLQAHRARADYSPDRPLRPWLFTIAMNLKRQYLRSKSRKPEGALDVEVTGDGPSVEKRFAARQASNLVRQAVEKLPEALREVVVLHWFEGLPFPEVAQVLGIQVSAARVRAHRAYKALRPLMEQVGVSPEGRPQEVES